MNLFTWSGINILSAFFDPNGQLCHSVVPLNPEQSHLALADFDNTSARIKHNFGFYPSLNDFLFNAQRIKTEDGLSQDDADAIAVPIISEKAGYFRFIYPKGSYSNSKIPGGARYKIGRRNVKRSMTVPLGLEEAWLSYYFRLSPNFNFAKGGKLHGICGGSCPGGGSKNTDGFSVRFAFGQHGYLGLYSYLPADIKLTDINNRIGITQPLPITIHPGQWYFVTTYIKLNNARDGVLDDGILEVHINHSKLYSAHNLIFRTKPSEKISFGLISTFFGGKGQDSASPVKSYSDLANYKIYTKAEDIDCLDNFTWH